MTDAIIVGAGLFGLTIANRLATAGRHVTIIEARDHVGGNAWATDDPDTGIEVHHYGAHIFHTSNERVWEYVNRFTRFTDYRHKVWALHDGQVHPLPFSLATLSSLLGRAVTPAEADGLLERVTNPDPANLEEKALALIGRPLYEAFVRDYTQKQWQTPPTELPARVISRLPFRLTYGTDYFNDTHQGIPLDGYAAWLQRMADHPRIDVRLSETWEPSSYSPDVTTVYTGPLDRLHGYSEGPLGWRTVDFELDRYDVQDHQGTAVVNFADASELATRSIEFAHFRPDREHEGTVVAREFSRWAGPGDEPYYPVNRPEDRVRVDAYKEATVGVFPGLLVGGRLGSYQYLDMHMAVGSALVLADRVLGG